MEYSKMEEFKLEENCNSYYQLYIEQLFNIIALMNIKIYHK